MPFDPILERFIAYTPATVMVRAILERVLTAERINQCFQDTADFQYTRNLLFSSVFDLFSLVVLNVFPSVNAAYKSNQVSIDVSLSAVYDKLNRLEPAISAALMDNVTKELGQVVKEMNATCSPLLEGYRVKILDGNCLAATEHRLKELRATKSGALPGKSLVVYDPQLDMAVNVFPCEDGHAQERALLQQVRQTIEPNDVFVMDRNFCVASHLIEIENTQAYFVCRLHQQTPIQLVGEAKIVGQTGTGSVEEQNIEIIEKDKTTHCFRLIRINLYKKTRDGDKVLEIITNLPRIGDKEVNAIKIAEIYKKRWSIETAFQQLEAHLQSEINTLAYPRAALFGFCIALIAFNIFAVVKASMRVVHGEEKINEEFSPYYLAGEIDRAHHGLGVIPIEAWNIFITMSPQAFSIFLVELAKKMKFSQYQKAKRGPKKPKPNIFFDKTQPHVSTAKLLLQRKEAP